MNPLETLRTKLAQITGDAKAVEAAAQAAGRAEFTTEETTRLNELHAGFANIEAQIKLHEQNAAIEAASAVVQPLKTQPSPAMGTTTTPLPAYGTASRTQPVAPNAGNYGFRHFAEFLGAVRNSSFGKLDPRLMNAITTYGGENTGVDGGFAVPPDFRASIMQAWSEDDNLMRLFSTISTNSNMLTLVSDETTPWSTSGITGAWYDEAAAITATKPVLKQINVPLRKVGALCHVSDELLEDSPAIGSYVATKMGQKLSALVSQAIVSGDGVGKPLGLVASPSYVVVTRTTAHKVKAEDVTNMVSRLRPGGFSKAFWLCHSSVLPQLWTMVLGGSTAATPIYATDYTKSPFGTLLGRPLYVSEYLADLTTGTSDATSYDLLLVNPDGYILAVKSSGVQTAATIAFGFDQAVNSFRATMRCGGQSLLSAAITRKSGSLTLSDCVGISHV